MMSKHYVHAVIVVVHYIIVLHDFLHRPESRSFTSARPPSMRRSSSPWDLAWLSPGTEDKLIRFSKVQLSGVV